MLRTEIITPDYPFEINHESNILSLGSCFSDNIGQYLHQRKFNIAVNPFGTIFNPISIFKLLDYAIRNEVTVEEQHIVLKDEVYRHFDFHSDIAETNLERFHTLLSSSIANIHQQLQSTNRIILTFGTAYCFEHIKTGEIVANCHKQPAVLFKKTLLGPEFIFQQFKSLYTLLPKDCEIIITVSPVRHTREGLSNNSLSKSILRYACELLAQGFSNVHYFPAYEMMIDDLREYRYYEWDLIHPNEIAINYIAQHFASTFFDEKTTNLNQQIEKIQKAVAHRPLFKDTKAHQKFVKDTINKLEIMNQQLDFKIEIEQMRTQLLSE